MDTNEVKHHISQLYSLPKDASLDFFDANLEYDTPVFIDPFLLKNSPVEEERVLFERFGDFFRFAYDESFKLSIGKKNVQKFADLLTFHEPKNIYMGYTAASNDGKGPNLTGRLLNYFLETSAKEYIRETKYFPENKYNPVSLQLFTDGVGPDGISDITANLLMDYLISYTIKQADIWGIKRASLLALDRDGFDFKEMEWHGGGYYDLPENPLRPGEPIIFVPRRLLRGLEEVRELKDDAKSRVFSILKADTRLVDKFSDLLSKSLKKVTNEEIRDVFLEEGSVHLRYLTELEAERTQPYDFKIDKLGLLSDKNYVDYFDKMELGQIKSCDQLKKKTAELVSLFDEEFSLRDGWKDAWKSETIKNKDGSNKTRMSPQTEPVIGRRFRGMGFSFFSHFPDVTFIAEVGTGNGFVDFQVIYLDCRIVIELKLLNNSSSKGQPKIPAYIHGITRQLPEYAKLQKAKHAFYVTGQHYNGKQGTGIDHTDRIDVIEDYIEEVERDLKKDLASFESLTYVNVKMMPRGSASTI